MDAQGDPVLPSQAQAASHSQDSLGDPPTSSPTPSTSPDVQSQAEADGAAGQSAQAASGSNTPPAAPTVDTELKVSRKREREVSIEPATPQATTIDIDGERSEHSKDRRAPAKKNRISAQLDAPQEDDAEDVTNESTPSAGSSPPHESKIRQISQGVEDLTWQNMQKQKEKDTEMETETKDPEPSRPDHRHERDHDATMTVVTEGRDQDTSEDADGDVAVTAEKGDALEETVPATVAGGDVVEVLPLLLQGENPPVVADGGAGVDEHGGDADPAEVPSEAQPPAEEILDTDARPEVSATSAVPPVPESPAPTPNAASAKFPSASSKAMPPPAPSGPPSRRSSESDSEQEKGLKRKFGDRTVSERVLPGEIPGAGGFSGLGTAAGAGSTVKRPRDDPDTDANPRVTKRPTPPPEEETSGPANGTTKGANATSQGANSPMKVTPNMTFGSPSQLTGFMAYASTSSPFASVSGPSLFGSKVSSPSFSSSAWSPNLSPAPSASPFSSTLSSPSKTPTAAPASPALKRTGFEAFASAASPFASAAKRPRSPPPLSLSSAGPSASVFGSALARSRSPSRLGARATSAFSSYAAGGAQSFAVAKGQPKRGSAALGESASAGAGTGLGIGMLDGGGAKQGDGDEEGEEEGGGAGASFGARLRAQKDEGEASEEERRVKLTEQEVHTGEEGEETIYQVRGKLYALSGQNQWKERGTGTLRLNVRREDGTGARLIMRKEAVFTLLLNATLFKGMRCFLAQDPRYLRFSVFESGATTHYNLRVQNAKIAEELLEEINSHIPTEQASGVSER